MSEKNKIPTKNLPKFKLNSSKGRQGRVLVVGGCGKYYGAPILTALGAEAAGADLIDLVIPCEHVNTAKNYSLNFFITSFQNSSLSLGDIDKILNLSKRNHCIAIGNGIGQSPKIQETILELLKNINIPVVLDAESLISKIFTIKRKKNWVILPHKGEFKRLFKNIDSIDIKTLTKIWAQYNLNNVTLCLKSEEDIVFDGNHLYLNQTGVPQMRVGGTGDGLAGIIAATIAQGTQGFEACSNAIYYYGLTGEDLIKSQYTLSAEIVIKHYSKIINKF